MFMFCSSLNQSSVFQFILQVKQNTSGDLVISLKTVSCCVLGSNWGHWNKKLFYLFKRCWSFYSSYRGQGWSHTGPESGLEAGLPRNTRTWETMPSYPVVSLIPAVPTSHTSPQSWSDWSRTPCWRQPGGPTSPGCSAGNSPLSAYSEQSQLLLFLPPVWHATY